MQRTPLWFLHDYVQINQESLLSTKDREAHHMSDKQEGVSLLCLPEGSVHTSVCFC